MAAAIRHGEEAPVLNCIIMPASGRQSHDEFANRCQDLGEFELMLRTKNDGKAMHARSQTRLQLMVVVHQLPTGALASCRGYSENERRHFPGHPG